MNVLTDLQIDTRPCEETSYFYDYDYDAGTDYDGGPVPAMMPLDFDGPIRKESVELLGAPGIPCA